MKMSEFNRYVDGKYVTTQLVEFDVNSIPTAPYQNQLDGYQRIADRLKSLEVTTARWTREGEEDLSHGYKVEVVDKLLPKYNSRIRNLRLQLGLPIEK
jgi:hypothetical protein